MPFLPLVWDISRRLTQTLATEVIMKGEIACPHWNACESCGHFGKHGCNLSHIDMFVHLGDFIICDDYVEANKPMERDRAKPANIECAVKACDGCGAEACWNRTPPGGSL